jgi:hypothetical protein
VAPIATAPGVRELVPQFGDGDAAAVSLLTTMEATGEALEPYFGADAADELIGLLRRHVLIAVELLSAVRSGDIERFKQEDERWIASATAIAEFLSSLSGSPGVSIGSCSSGRGFSGARAERTAAAAT